MRCVVAHHELAECLEIVPFRNIVEFEHAISVNRVVNDILRREAAKLDYFVKLIIVVFSWENRHSNEEFDDGAAEGPHVYALIVDWLSSDSLWALEVLAEADQHLWSPVKPRLNVGIELIPIERGTTVID